MNLYNNKNKKRCQGHHCQNFPPGVRTSTCVRALAGVVEIGLGSSGALGDLGAWGLGEFAPMPYSWGESLAHGHTTMVQTA